MNMKFSTHGISISGVTRNKVMELYNRVAAQYETTKNGMEESKTEHTTHREPMKRTTHKRTPPPRKTRKQPIPKAVKDRVWFNYFGEAGTALCLCCKHVKIYQSRFACGHIVSEHNGGLVHIDNLRPICQSCNSSMGTMNMDEFITRYGF